MPTVTSQDGTSIAYSNIGAGPPLLLIDGAMGFRAFGPLAALAKVLSSTFTVFTYDRRGRGESGNTAPYSIAREVEDIQAIIDIVRVPVNLYGLSSGAALALEAAAAGLRIKSMALYDPAVVGSNQRYTEELQSLLSRGERGDAVALFMTTVGTPPEVITGMRNAPVWPVFESIAPTLAYDNAFVEAWEPLEDRAAEIKVPTLVIDGSAAPEMLQRAAHDLAAALPNAQHRTLKDQTHDVSPDALASALIEFFIAAKS